MAASPKRRWFQFRLRTLLVGVVLLGAACAYVAHEYRIVAERKAWLARHPQSQERIIRRGFDSSTLPENQRPKSTIPLVRRWLGDQPHDLVDVWNPDDEASAKQLFPEAMIHREFADSAK